MPGGDIYLLTTTDGLSPVGERIYELLQPFTRDPHNAEMLHILADVLAVGGTTQVIAGAGGDGFVAATEDSAVGTSAWVDDTTVAVLRLTLSPTGIAGDFITAASGSVLRSFTVDAPSVVEGAHLVIGGELVSCDPALVVGGELVPVSEIAS